MIGSSACKFELAVLLRAIARHVSDAMADVLHRHSLTVTSPWRQLLHLLPLSPNAFIAGSAATWLALRSLGLSPEWVPADVNVYCLCDRSQFLRMVEEFAAAALFTNPVAQCSASGDLDHHWKFDVPIRFESFDDQAKIVTFMHVPHMPDPNLAACRSICSVVSNFDIDVCRVVIRSETKYMCSDHVFRQLNSMSMSFTLSVQSGTIGLPFSTPDRFFKYMDRGFRLAYWHVNVRSAELIAMPARIRFFNTAITMLQHIMTASFYIDEAVSSQVPRMPATLASLLCNHMQHSRNVDAAWMTLLSNIPLCMQVFMAGEAAAWWVLSTKYIISDWLPECYESINIFCVVERPAFHDIVLAFAASSSCTGHGNVFDASVISDATATRITVMSQVGPVCFYHTQPSYGINAAAVSLNTMSRVLSLYDISLCRIAVTALCEFYCSPSTHIDVNDATFSFELLPQRNGNRTINRVHRFLSRGFKMKRMHADLNSISEIASHERIVMFHNAMMMCMSLTNGATRHNQLSQLFGRSGINTLYPVMAHQLRELPPPHN